MEYCRSADQEIDEYIGLFPQIEVLPGSPIYAANNQSTLRSYSETVSVPILSALDHLRLVTKSVLGLGGSLPFAHATPLRTALTVASTALWLMHDDDDKRAARAAMLNYHDCSNYLIWLRLRSSPDVSGGKYPGLTDHMERIERKRDHYASEALGLGVDVTRAGWKITGDYDVTVAASTMVAPSSWDGYDPKTEIPVQWRMLSAYAHGLRWATSPGTTQGIPDSSGFAATTMTFDLDRLMESTNIVRAVVIAAMNRYNELAGHPRPQQ